jgi:hypothetical protein
MMQSIVKGDNLYRVLAMALMRLDEDYIYGVARRYYKACTDAYIPIFFAWRDEIEKLQ